MKFDLSAGNRHDAPEDRKLIESIDFNVARYLVMDRAYEDDKTRALALKQGLIPVVPPKKNRKSPWQYDAELHKRRNEVERFSFVLNDSEKFLLATTNLILCIFLS